jgi:hypothetical protein
MRSSILVIVLAVAVVAWLPTAASAGVPDPLGACSADFNPLGQAAFECINDVTEADCADFCGSNCFWDGGLACTDLRSDWLGSCFFDDVPPGGGCWLWWVEPGANTAEFHCEVGSGQTWFDDLVCGGAPVPAMPKVAYAALALVLLGGTLTLLTLYSRP